MRHLRKQKRMEERRGRSVPGESPRAALDWSLSPGPD